LAAILTSSKRANADGPDRLHGTEPKGRRPMSHPPHFTVEIRLCMLWLIATGPRIYCKAMVRPAAEPEPQGYLPRVRRSAACSGSCLGSWNSIANCLSFPPVAGAATAPK
jgi:hypothetical protein